MPALVAALQQAALFAQRRKRFRKRPQIPRARWPNAARLAYLKSILELLDVVETLVRRDLLPMLPSILGPHTRGDALRLDATGSTVDATVDRIKDELDTIIPEPRISLITQDAAVRVSEHNRGELQRQVNAVAKINLFDEAEGLTNHIDAFVSDNVRLIKSVTSDELDQVKGIVLKGAREGLRHEVVADQIQARFGVARSRAALIASDQVGKLNGELTGMRQQQLGIERYKWSTSQDERVRKSHQRLDGTIQRWDSPPIVDGEPANPGAPVRCRCQAIPLVDDVLVQAGLMAPEDAEPPTPVRTPITKPPSIVPPPKPTPVPLLTPTPPKPIVKLPLTLPPPEPPPTPPRPRPVPVSPGPPPIVGTSGVQGAGPVKLSIDPGLRERVKYGIAHPRPIDESLTVPIDDALNAALGLSVARQARDWADQWVKGTTISLATTALTELQRPGSWAQAQYEATQQLIANQLPELRAKALIDDEGYITLYRGVSGAQGAAICAAAQNGLTEVDLGVYDVSSWSESQSIAHGFAFAHGPEGAAVLRQRIHYTRAFAQHTNQSPDWNPPNNKKVAEREWAIIGETGKIRATIVETGTPTRH